MGCASVIIFGHRSRHLINFFLLILLITCWNRVRIIAEGRALPKMVKSSLEGSDQRRSEEEVVMVRSLIGSRPPRCERRCGSCGHCEAVQVPIVPSSLKHQDQVTKRSHQYFKTATATIAYSRGDDISNYKPMCWKCKCGNIMFNP